MDRIVGMLLTGAVLLTASSWALPGAGQSSETAPQTAAAPAAAASQTAVPGQTAAATPFAANPGSAAGQAAVPLPEARFANPDYYAMPGQTITFNVSESLPRGVNIAQYEWDFDGDGVIDEVGPIPVTTHSYPAVFEGAATVRITHATGGSSTASTGVHIGRGPRDGLPAAPVNVGVVVTAHSGGISTVHITWEPDGPEPYRWGVTVDGFPAGMVEGEARTATMTDVHRAKDVEIGVVGFSENGGMGANAGVTLPALPY
jgi:hypothetical protein